MRVLADRCQGDTRTGKVMLYNAENGKRIKEPFNHVTWVHSLLKMPDFNLRQCFFGEHLADEPRQAGCHCREREDRLVAAYYLPEYVWLATGGKNGCFNADALRVLRGYQVILYPDIGATDQWRQKLSCTQSRHRAASSTSLKKLPPMTSEQQDLT